MNAWFLLIVAALVSMWALGRAYDAEFASGQPVTPHVKLGDGSLIRAIRQERIRTWRCQNVLSRPRTATSYAAERSRSIAFRKWAHRLWRKRAQFNCHLARQLSDPVRAIYAVFGVYGAQAVRVAHCETGGTFHVGARNGQYLGIFQMGEWERATYGHGSTALEQARAAYRYFRASGYSWRAWACKP